MSSMTTATNPSQKMLNDQVFFNDASSFKNMNDQQLLAAMMTAFYNPEHIPPFQYANLSCDQLPLTAQEMVHQYELAVPPKKMHEELTVEGLSPTFQRILAVREAEMARLRQNMNTVHRAIAFQLLALSSGDASAGAILKDTLIPEWRSRLDDHLARVDALIWFEMEIKKGSQLQMRPQEYLGDRMEDVHRMFVFTVQCLQITKQSMETESQVEHVLSKLNNEISAFEVSVGCDTSDESCSEFLEESGSESCSTLGT